jgi:MFS family permease
MSWGHRPVLLISLVGAMASLLAFALIAQIGLTGALTVPLLFTLILVSRGVVFGLAWAATPVTAQSYVAATSRGTAERVRGMSMIGAAQGLGLAVGPALGGALSLTSLLAPIYLAPLILAIIAVLVSIGLPKPRDHRSRPSMTKISPFDRRMWPFLTAGFGMYLAFSIVLMTIGFLLQDRLHLTAQQTGRTIGLVMLAGAGMIIIVQSVAVPRLGFRPTRIHVRTDAARHPRGTGSGGRASRLQQRGHLHARPTPGHRPVRDRPLDPLHPWHSAANGPGCVRILPSGNTPDTSRYLNPRFTASSRTAFFRV